jgi:hypothetical protein
LTSKSGRKNTKKGKKERKIAETNRSTKNLMVVGCKIFIRAEAISRDEEVEVMLAGLAMVVGSKWMRSRFKCDLDLADDLG